MSDELIRKSEVLRIFESWRYCDNVDGFAAEIKDLPPINAVELPCKVGDKLYIVYDDGVEEKECVGFWVTSSWVQIQLPYDETFTMWDGAETYFGRCIFTTREEAEKALRTLNSGESKVKKQKPFTKEELERIVWEIEQVNKELREKELEDLKNEDK